MEPKAEEQASPPKYCKGCVFVLLLFATLGSVEPLSVSTEIWVTWRDTNGDIFLIPSFVNSFK